METTSHSHISKTCLAYLAQFDRVDSLNENSLQAYPLSKYAAKSWIYHAKSGKIDSTPDLQKLTTHFLLHDHVRANWVRIWDIDTPWKRADLTRAPHTVASPLYYASMACLGVVVKTLIESGADVNVQGGRYGSALQAASYQGSEAIVKMLIESGADVNVQGGYYGSALGVALSFGYSVIAQLLLDNGAEVGDLPEPASESETSSSSA